MSKRNSIPAKAMALFFLCVILLMPGISPSARASSVDTNTLVALVNGTNCTLQLTSFMQVGCYAPIFTQTGDNGYPLAAVTLYIPLDAKAGSVYESGDGNDYVGVGVAYSDYAAGAAYSTLAVSTNGDDYFGFAAGQTAWTLAIDDVNADGSVIRGSFDVFYESAFYGSGEPATLYDGAFCLDLAQLPSAPSETWGSGADIADSSLDSLFGSLGAPGMGDSSSGSFLDALGTPGVADPTLGSSGIPGSFGFTAGSGESTPCTYCKGKGYTRLCSYCDGLGYNSPKDVLYKGAYVCPSCLGEGKIICVICGGDGLVAP